MNQAAKSERKNMINFSNKLYVHVIYTFREYRLKNTKNTYCGPSIKDIFKPKEWIFGWRKWLAWCCLCRWRRYVNTFKAAIIFGLLDEPVDQTTPVIELEHKHYYFTTISLYFEPSAPKRWTSAAWVQTDEWHHELRENMHGCPAPTQILRIAISKQRNIFIKLQTGNIP